MEVREAKQIQIRNQSKSECITHINIERATKQIRRTTTSKEYGRHHDASAPPLQQHTYVEDRLGAARHQHQALVIRVRFTVQIGQPWTLTEKDVREVVLQLRQD